MSTRESSVLITDQVHNRGRLTGHHGEDFFCMLLCVYRMPDLEFSGVINTYLWLVITTTVQVEGQPVTYLVGHWSPPGCQCSSARVT
jgi:hypothetical protein